MLSPRLEGLLKVLLGLGACALAVAAIGLFAIPTLPAGARPWDNDAAAIRTLQQLAQAPATSRRLFEEVQLGTDGLPTARSRGFYFRAFACDADAEWTAVSLHDAALAAVTTGWRCYAWPVLTNISGKRTFCVDDQGVLRWRYARGQYGGDRAPSADTYRDGEEHRWNRIR